MKDNKVLEEEKLNIDQVINEKDIDRGNQVIRYLKEKKNIIKWSVAAILISIMVILIISSITGYTY